MLTPALVLAAVVQSASFTPSDALVAPSHRHARLSLSSALYYSNGGDDGETYFSPLPTPRPLHRRGRKERLRQHRQDVTPPMAKSTDDTEARSRHIPRRAMPHVKHASNEEAATRAGYIIRETQMSSQERRINGEQRQMADGGVRPLRSIRRIVHRSRADQQQVQQNQIRIEGPNNSLDVLVRNRPKNERTRLSLSNQSQLDEFLDKPEQLSPDREQRKGANRVTFKATRKASKAVLSKPVASLTEYMTQPVSQYSLLSFHDAEGLSKGNDDSAKNPRSRRWLVRRLSSEEAQQYISNSAISAENDEAMDESNLFRLAVPLLPLIGWDLTPVIDLEVIPPKLESALTSDADPAETEMVYKSCDLYTESPSGWAPLRGIRKRINPQEVDASSSDALDSTPVVKIRSLRVSLLSTQEEVKEIMSNKKGQPSRRDSNMQKEAIEMVSKVEEWLRPHITFEAELAWTDGVATSAESDSLSTVTVRSTAITSLTIPKIPSDILRKTVPSAFVVKRLGATLTSQALAICLPRFLRQLEKDYNRWSGLGLGAESVENDNVTS